MGSTVEGNACQQVLEAVTEGCLIEDIAAEREELGLAPETWQAGYKEISIPPNAEN